MASALEQAHGSGVDPGLLLRDVAAERELGSAWHPAQVLNLRLEQGPGSAADVVASSFPTPVTSAPLHRGLVDDLPGTNLGSTRKLTRHPLPQPRRPEPPPVPPPPAPYR